VKIRKSAGKTTCKGRSGTSRAGLTALVAAGSGLAAGSAAALELGELQVQSTLGQPLRASIAYALSPNETIDERCIAVRPTGTGLPGLRNVEVLVSTGIISIKGASPVKEPILSANIVVDCPKSAHVSRNYLMFVDPRKPVADADGRSIAAAAPAIAPAPIATASQGPAPAMTPVAQDSRYPVQPGDSLSGIVSRLERLDVPASIAASAIFDANREAFIDGDPDRLKAGSWLDIPMFAGNALADVTGVSPTQAAHEVSRTAKTSTTPGFYRGAETLEPDVRKQVPATEFLPDAPDAGAGESAATEAASAAAVDSAVEEPVEAADYSAAYGDLVTGDVVIDAAPAAPANAPARVVKPGVGTRVVGRPEPAGSSWNWLTWAAIALISAFGGYLVFWPKLRERFASRPVGPEAVVPPPVEPAAPMTLPESEITVEEIRATYNDVDFDLSDDAPTEENTTLDADLIDGTGLNESPGFDGDREYEFAATMDLDMELRETPDAADSNAGTDIIPPPATPEDLVVSNEVLPDDNDDEYDISMVIDATKMPDPAEVTERDLRAVPLDDTGHGPVDDDYTIIDEVGRGVLEQDYEDERDTTPLSNAEVDQVVSELAQIAGADEPTAFINPDDGAGEDAGQTGGLEGDTSSGIKLANLSELDLATTLDAQNDDDPDVTASVESEDKTVEMPRDRDGARAR
jgi:hypothetical protein